MTERNQRVLKMPAAQPPTKDALAKGRFKLLSVGELLHLPDQQWLVEGILPAGGLAVVYGKAEAGKTHVALDLGMNVAGGTPWHGRAVQGGAVVYVVGEGGSAFGRRVKAGLAARGLADLTSMFFVMEAPQMHEGDEHEILGCIQERGIRPVLVVLDTFARCFVGGEENSAKEVGLFIGGTARLQAELGATVLLVHHTGKDSDIERGSSALRGAADAMFSVERIQGRRHLIQVSCRKMKDAEHFSALRFELVSQDVGHGSLGESLTAGVLRPIGGMAETLTTLTPRQRKLLASLEQLDRGTTMAVRTKDWMAASGGIERRFHRDRKVVLEGGWVCKEGNGYCLTEAGRRALLGSGEPPRETDI